MPCLVLLLTGSLRRPHPLRVLRKAWTILQNTYKGTKAVKDSKLQRLTTSFEKIRMDDNKKFDKFYAKLKDIVNSTFNLGEKIP